MIQFFVFKLPLINPNNKMLHQGRFLKLLKHTTLINTLKTSNRSLTSSFEDKKDFFTLLKSIDDKHFKFRADYDGPLHSEKYIYQNGPINTASLDNIISLIESNSRNFDPKEKAVIFRILSAANNDSKTANLGKLIGKLEGELIEQVEKCDLIDLINVLDG